MRARSGAAGKEMGELARARLGFFTMESKIQLVIKGKCSGSKYGTVSARGINAAGLRSENTWLWGRSIRMRYVSSAPL